MSRRRTVANALQLIPGVEYVRSVLGSVPDWVTLREHERCAWVNRILDDAWRFFDKAISDRLAEWVLPELEKFKPPFIHSIEFKRISCGGVPFTVEHISVSSWTHEDIVLEVDAAWNSDADIQLLIQTSELAFGHAPVPSL